MTSPTVVEFWASHGGQSVTPLLRAMVTAKDSAGEIVKQAYDALMVRPDYTSNAWAAGWCYEADQSEWRRTNDAVSDGYDYANTAETACRVNGTPVVTRAQVEHPVVSPWLGEQLELYGERMFEVGGLKVWMKDAEVPALEHPALIAIANAFEPESVPTPAYR